MGYFKYLIIFLFPIFAQGKRCGFHGNWIEYKDEKCYSFVDTFTTAQDALTLCLSKDPTASLPVVKSVDEQKFIDDFLYLEHGVLDGVWLGATRVNSSQEFAWSNGDDLRSFSNWAQGYPSLDSNKKCVRMISNLARTIQAENGQWSDVSCGSRNLVLCQKRSEFSHEELVAELLKLRFNFNEAEKDTQIEIEALKKDFDQMESDMDKIIPVGFLYFQVGSQPSPKDIWPRYIWTDVSGDYSGLFFRVTGGGSAPIGQIQSENAPRLGGVIYGNKPYPSEYPYEISVPTSGWSDYIQAGFFPGAAELNREGLGFKMTNIGEVRPKNTAMRVWKRI